MRSIQPEFPSKNESSVQHQIEAIMKRFETEGRWECIFLFSSEGFPMAGSGKADLYGEDNLMEFAFSLIQTVKMLGENMPVKEVWIRGHERKTLVFRYFEAWNERVILAAVVSGRKGYRRALKELVGCIQNINLAI